MSLIRCLSVVFVLVLITASSAAGLVVTVQPNGETGGAVISQGEGEASTVLGWGELMKSSSEDTRSGIGPAAEPGGGSLCSEPNEAR